MQRGNFPPGKTFFADQKPITFAEYLKYEYDRAAFLLSQGLTPTDTFEPTLTITGVTFNGAAWTSPEDYTYDAATGAFATVAGKLTVPEATFTQNADGSWAVTPGQSILTVTGTV